MKILITGGRGFVGTALSEDFLKKGHSVTLVDHGASPAPGTSSNLTYISADTSVEGSWQEAVRDQDAVINLAGASVFKRWSPRVKSLIRDSRVLTTKHVVDALPSDKNVFLFSASAIGFYGHRGDEIITERERPGNCFLAQVCVDWEKEALQAEAKGARVVLARFGLILAKSGGALAKMKQSFEFYLGGAAGTGKQWVSWIHMEDLVRAVSFVFQHEDISGPVNFCAPNPVQNQDMAAIMGKVLHRPAVATAPVFALKMALGEFSSLILDSQRIVPEALERYGFEFKYPDIVSALEREYVTPE